MDKQYRKLGRRVFLYGSLAIIMLILTISNLIHQEWNTIKQNVFLLAAFALITVYYYMKRRKMKAENFYDFDEDSVEYEGYDLEEVDDDTYGELPEDILSE